ncbi:MAG: type IV secretory system conjugative DNA transfer family protein [Actinobacteria bacterium]|nr:type IV secretory system conjugative DNA transfer family protein [Actinomycetota bacterium]
MILEIRVPFAGQEFVIPTWLIVAAVVLFVVIALLHGILGGRGPSPEDELDRERASSRRWADVRDVRELLLKTPDPRRLRLGQLNGAQVGTPPLRSKLVLAPTGSGKTPRVMVPDVLLHQGPAVVASVKADILYLTHKARMAKGPVWVFDPTGASGFDTCRWSPLSGIHSYGDAMRAARWLCESSKVEKAGLEGQQYWDTQGRQMLAPMLFAAARLEKSMADVGAWVQTGAEDKLRRMLTELGDQTAINAWGAHCNSHERTKTSIAGTAWMVMESWSHPSIANAVNDAGSGRHEVFSIGEFLSSGGTLYMVAPASEQDLFTPVFETLTNAVIQAVEVAAHKNLGLPLDPPLLLVLDEAANIAPLRRLDQVASKSAGEGVVLVSAWQDEGQIASIYGADRGRTVFNQHTCHVYLPGIGDIQTLQTLSTKIGLTTVQRESTTRDKDGRTSRSRSASEIELAPAAWLRQLPQDQCIAIVKEYKPIRLRIPGWFEDPALRKLVDPEVARRFDEQFARPKRSPKTSRRRPEVAA